MKKPSPHLSLLLCALLGLPATALADTSSSSSYDDRWYLTVGAGANNQDSARDTKNSAFGTIGVGKFVNPRWSVDAELNYQNPKAHRNNDLNFSQYGLSVDARRHFRQDGRRLNPYIVGGVGYQRAHEEYDAFPSPYSPGKDKRGYATAKLGVGAQWDFERVALRGEIAARHSFDSNSVVAPNKNGFTDTLASLTMVVPLGARAQEVAPPIAPVVAQTAPRCEDLDDDNDGVSNCQDMCLDSPPNQPVNIYGCEVAIAIDLRTVHFAFDQSSISPQGQAALNNVVDVLNMYPHLRVQVTGHTDSVGSERYNQKLSERRAEAVFYYLIDKGIAPDRLDGPIGYGETRPVAPNTFSDGSDNPEGRARNRRAELNVENDTSVD